jgi:hypothetical protein
MTDLSSQVVWSPAALRPYPPGTGRFRKREKSPYAAHLCVA